MITGGGTDLARLYAFHNRSASVREKMDIASNELTTGLKKSSYEATSGNLNRLFTLENQLDRNEAYGQNIILTEQRLAAMQSTLGMMEKASNELGIELMTKPENFLSSVVEVEAETARLQLTEMLSSLNIRVAGQQVYGGTNTATASVADIDTIMGDIQALVAAEVTTAGVLAQIDAYFAKPAGGFHTTGYLGTTDDLAPTELNDHSSIAFAKRADDDVILAALSAHAAAAILTEGALAGDITEQTRLVKAAGERMVAAGAEMVTSRSVLGSYEQVVEEAKVANEAENTYLEMSRLNIRQVDPSEAAARVMALETQLQSVFTLTRRIAELRFVNFM